MFVCLSVCLDILSGCLNSVCVCLDSLSGILDSLLGYLDCWLHLHPVSGYLCCLSNCYVKQCRLFTCRLSVLLSKLSEIGSLKSVSIYLLCVRNLVLIIFKLWCFFKKKENAKSKFSAHFILKILQYYFKIVASYFLEFFCIIFILPSKFPRNFKKIFIKFFYHVKYDKYGVVIKKV